jgi:autotransporter-associated beta strand protein
MHATFGSKTTFINRRLAVAMIAGAMTFVGSLCRAQSNGDVLLWNGGTGESNWKSTNPVWYDSTSSSDVSIASSSATNTYEYEFGGVVGGLGTIAPNTTSIAAAGGPGGVQINASYLSFFGSNFAQDGASMTIQAPTDLAYAINFTTDPVTGNAWTLNDGGINGNGGTVTFSAPNNGGFGGLYATLNGPGSVLVGTNTTVVMNISLLDGTSSGGINKGFDGTLVLGGTNQYTGPTTVSGGTLLVNGTIGSGAVTVSSGATLGGTGLILGNTTINSGGFIAPGNGPASIGTISIGRSVTSTLQLSGTYLVDLMGNGSSDKINGAGTFTLTGSTLSLNMLNQSGLSLGETFVIATNSTPIVGVFSNAATTVSDNLGDTYNVNYNSGQLDDITLTVATIAPVPEPSTIESLLSGMMILVIGTIRRRRR